MTADEWRHRAEREAAAILAESVAVFSGDYQLIVTLMAMAWMQGTIYGSHETLALAEQAVDSLRVEL